MLLQLVLQPQSVLERTIREGDSPVERNGDESGWYPEYHEARETLWEAGETTLQGSIPSATDSELVP